MLSVRLGVFVWRSCSGGEGRIYVELEKVVDRDPSSEDDKYPPPSLP